MRRVLPILALGAALASAGCGYSLRGNLPEHLKTIAVPVFQNRTLVPNVESFLTTAVRNAFVTNGRLRVVGVDQADSILEGDITIYSLSPIAYNATANVTQYRLAITLNLRYRDVRQNKVLLQRQGYSDRVDFPVPGTVADSIAAAEAALQSVSTEIAKTVVSYVVDQF